MSDITPIKWVDIIGPNGLIIDNGIMYVASYPADGTTTDANVIYQITDFANPVVEKFTILPGQYDGIALSADKRQCISPTGHRQELAVLICRPDKLPL